jgi:hypothetical protein
MIIPAKNSSSALDGSAAALQAEAARARKAIDQSKNPEIEGTRRLAQPIDGYVQGQIHDSTGPHDQGTMLAVSKQGDSTVVLRTQDLAKKATGLQVASALVGGLLGFVLSAGHLTGGIAGASLAALATSDLDTPAGQRIEKVTTDSEGVTTEISEPASDGTYNYQSTFNRTGPAPVIDTKKTIDWINNLKI